MLWNKTYQANKEESHNFTNVLLCMNVSKIILFLFLGAVNAQARNASDFIKIIILVEQNEALV